MNNNENMTTTANKLRKGHQFLTTSNTGAGVLATVLDVRHSRDGRVLLALNYGENGRLNRATVTLPGSQTIALIAVGE